MPSLREVRNRKLMSIRDLAAAADVTTRTIVQIEAGEVTPRPSTMRKIAAALQTAPETIAEFARAIEQAIAEDAGKVAAVA